VSEIKYIPLNVEKMEILYSLFSNIGGMKELIKYKSRSREYEGSIQTCLDDLEVFQNTVSASANFNLSGSSLIKTLKSLYESKNQGYPTYRLNQKDWKDTKGTFKKLYNNLAGSINSMKTKAESSENISVPVGFKESIDVLNEYFKTCFETESLFDFYIHLSNAIKLLDDLDNSFNQAAGGNWIREYLPNPDLKDRLKLFID